VTQVITETQAALDSPQLRVVPCPCNSCIIVRAAGLRHTSDVAVLVDGQIAATFATESDAMTWLSNQLTSGNL
jgi:hypothetical protein